MFLTASYTVKASSYEKKESLPLYLAKSALEIDKSYRRHCLHGTLLQHFNTFNEEPKIQRANSLPTTAHKHQGARNFHQIQIVSQEINSVYYDRYIKILKKMCQLFVHLQTYDEGQLKNLFIL